LKIILSRKGFDSQYGRVPSPILPDGTIISFPIPSSSGRPLGDIETTLGPMHSLVSDLSAGMWLPKTSVHLDPDLQASSVPRKRGWKPSFGQVGSAQRHLERQGVCVGDVFLFFGWFRPVELQHGKWRYRPGVPGIHSLFGWLQVGEILQLSERPELPAWMDDHPHVAHAERMGAFNTLYVATTRLALKGVRKQLPGAGVFAPWSERLQLTAPGKSRSVWRLPSWMAPTQGGAILSYHGSPERWSTVDGHSQLKSVAKGQEFVREVDSLDGYRWLTKLVESHS